MRYIVVSGMQGIKIYMCATSTVMPPTIQYHVTPHLIPALYMRLRCAMAALYSHIYLLLKASIFIYIAFIISKHPMGLKLITLGLL